jgi:hypothetical protein
MRKSARKSPTRCSSFFGSSFAGNNAIRQIPKPPFILKKRKISPILKTFISLHGESIAIHMDYFGLMKGFILSPVETFREVRDTDLGDSLKYYLVLLVINAVLSAIVGIAMVSAVWLTFSGIAEQLGVPLPAIAGVGVVLFAIVMIVVQFILVFIGAAWLHIFVYLLGGGQGYLQTLKSVTFGSTPSMLLGWIPFIGMFAGIWSLALEILGVRELQEMTTGRAALAVILAILVIVIIVIAVAAIFIIAFSEITPLPFTGF